jgi:hypothetical protein
MSAVVKPERMETGERPLSRCSGTRQRFVREMVDQGRRPDSLGNIPTPVVALDEHSARILGAWRHPSVPDVRHKEGNVTCFGDDGYSAAAVPFEVVVGRSVHWWCLSRSVTSRNHSSGASLDRAVPEVQVSCDGKNGIGDPGIPRHIGITGYMRSAVDVPEASEVVVVARGLPPGGVGDDMAILPQKGLNDLENSWVADGAPDEAAPVEHFVAKRRRLLGEVSSFIRWELVKDPFDLGTERGDLIFREHVIE